MKSFKIRKLKCGSYPAKADVKKQREFYENTLHPLMEKANNEEVNLFHVDASHFIMGDDHKGGIYGVFRRFKLTFSGRSRYNVLGALNHTSKKVHTITNDTDSKDKYITSKQVCRLLVRLSKEYVATKKPIVLILDNAKYQRCSLVQKVAQRLRIQLVFIPPYSPNLNLIERLWKFTKGELCTATYSNFQEFKEAIDEIIESTVGKNKQRIDSLIGEKVQLFDEVVTVQEPEKNDKAA